MAADRPTMVDLANEYGISLREVFGHLKQLGFDKTNSTKQLTPKQTEAFRRRMKTEASRRQRPQVVYPQPRTSVEATPLPEVRLETFHATCTCCSLGFKYLAPNPLPPLFCDLCMPHSPIPGEDLARQVARHKDHEARLRIALAKKTEAAAHSASEADRAFRARQGWLVALTEVCMLHEEREDHTCTCGVGRYPCATVKKVEEVNKGIARRIEHLLSLNPAQLDRILYPAEPPREWDWEDELDLEDGEPAASEPRG